MPEQFDQFVVNDERMKIGNQVGASAMEYFGDYKEVPYIPEMLTITQRFLEEGTRVIAEASFSYDGNFCRVDLLRAVSGGYEIIEVKSSTASPGDSPNTVKSIYFHDMAYQLYVLTQCGINVKKVTIMQLNREYKRQGELNLKKLFVLIDCTKIVMSMQSDMPRCIQEIKNAATQSREPVMDIGGHCNSPYECGFKIGASVTCRKTMYLTLVGVCGEVNKEAAYKAGFISFEYVVNGNVKLSEKQSTSKKNLAHLFPDLASHLLNINDNMTQKYERHYWRIVGWIRWQW